MDENRKKAWINSSIIILNIIIFLIPDLFQFLISRGRMMELFAVYPPGICEEHQYYRLITSVFLHFDIRHLLNNMLVLFITGQRLETAMGHFKYLCFYLLCGLGGNAVSLGTDFMTGEMTAISAGASGAIFGVVGGLLWAVIKNRGKLEDLSGIRLGLMALLSLYLGFVNTRVDNGAHVGGLLTGILLGVVIYREPLVKNKRNY